MILIFFLIENLKFQNFEKHEKVLFADEEITDNSTIDELNESENSATFSDEASGSSAASTGVDLSDNETDSDNSEVELVSSSEYTIKIEPSEDLSENETPSSNLSPLPDSSKIEEVSEGSSTSLPVESQVIGSSEEAFENESLGNSFENESSTSVITSPLPVSSSEIQVSSSEIPISSSLQTVSSSEVQISSSEVQVSSSEIPVSSSEVQISSSEEQVSYSEISVSSSEEQVSSSEVQV
jgi:hypothetical protein